MTWGDVGLFGYAVLLIIGGSYYLITGLANLWR